MDVLQEIKRVFGLEISTLMNVRDRLDQSYTRAAELIFDCSGKVVVSGMGKSGLVAQKIAATMVSTGTVAVFLHAADGNHGGVGIIQPGDVVLAISKSGETDELLSMLLYVKKIEVPLVAITANLESTLGRSSDVVLFTPVDEEACPLNLAPTSSTTAAMVVGDALAMALMKMRGFNPDQFAQFHPGGQLGKRLLMDVEDVMRDGENNPIINIEDSSRNLLSEISSKRCGAVSVVNDERKLVGLVTDFDIRNVLENGLNLFSLQIPDIMNSSPTFIYSDQKASDALKIMEDREKPFLVLPVLARGSNKVVGMIHLHDLLAHGL